MGLLPIPGVFAGERDLNMATTNGSLINRNVLMLNQNYEPLTVCSARRAIVLLFQGKAEMIETADGLKLHTVRAEYRRPLGRCDCPITNGCRTSGSC